MPLFRRGNSEPFGPNGALVRDFVDLASSLSPAEMARVDEAAIRAGFVTGHELALAIALIVTAGGVLKLSGERERARRAGSDAIARCPGARGVSPVLAYAAGVMAEAIVVRDALDPKTWAFVTEPWRTICEVSPLYEGDEPEAVAGARAARAAVEAR